MSVSCRICFSSSWIWGGNPYEWSTLPLIQLTLSDIKLTLSLHAPSRIWLPLSLYNIWIHMLHFHFLNSFEVWYFMKCPGRLLLPTGSQGLTTYEIWLPLSLYLVGPYASQLVESPAPPHNHDSMRIFEVIFSPKSITRRCMSYCILQSFTKPWWPVPGHFNVSR
jgi:hypothetical protein